MVQTDCDLLVIGGGPGGSCAAALARKRGLAVCLAEREEFPRFHIGESLLPIGNEILRESGAWPKVEAAGFVRKLGAEFMTAGGRQAKEIVFAEGYVPGLDYAYQVERARFDAILLEHARGLGADVRTGTTVRALDEEDGLVRARLQPASGPEYSVTARWAIDACGRENLYSSGLKAEFDPAPFPKRAAVYTHFDGVRRAAGPKGGNIVIVRVEDGWFWLIPISETRTSVGLVTSAAALRAGDGPESAFRRTVAASPRLSDIMSGAAPAAPFRVTADYSYVRRRFCSPRVVLVGDSANFYDPIFSSGVYISTYSARLAVGMISAARAGGRPLTRSEQRSYTGRLKRHCGAFRKLIEVFYDNHGFEVFMTQEPPWDLNRGLVSIVAGHVRLTWPLWWRFRVFLLVCWLQRHLPLVPRIGHGTRVSPASA
jgi:flavin-dependent dehydrogenase